jgi:hypothetical protein
VGGRGRWTVVSFPRGRSADPATAPFTWRLEAAAEWRALEPARPSRSGPLGSPHCSFFPALGGGIQTAPVGFFSDAASHLGSGSYLRVASKFGFVSCLLPGRQLKRLGQSHCTLFFSAPDPAHRVSGELLSQSLFCLIFSFSCGLSNFTHINSAQGKQAQVVQLQFMDATCISEFSNSFV